MNPSAEGQMLSLILNDILHELRAIRELLEWDKADTLKIRATRAAEAEIDKAEMLAFNEAMIEQAAEKVRDLNRQALEQYNAALQRTRAEHESLFHGGGARGKTKAN